MNLSPLDKLQQRATAALAISVSATSAHDQVDAALACAVAANVDRRLIDQLSAVKSDLAAVIRTAERRRIRLLRDADRHSKPT